MKPAHSLILLASIYLLVQAVGLRVGWELISGIREGVVQPAVPEPEKLASSLSIFMYVLILTAILLILLKLGLNAIIKILIYVALYAGTLITFTTLFKVWGFALATAYYLTALILRKNTTITNLTLILTTSGIGALLGASLATKPSLLLLIILSAYDITAVYGTKHMVTLAEKTKDTIPFMFKIPVNDKHLGLGTGDLTLPLVFTVSVLRDHTLANSAITAIGGLIGLTILFHHTLQKEKATLPALPPIAAGLLLGYATSTLLIG